MFLTVQNQPKRKSRLQYFVFFFYFLFIFLVEVLYRNYLYSISINIISDIQLTHEENFKILYPISKILSDLGNIIPFGFITIFFYCFCNIYKTLTLIASLFLSSLFTGMLKMIYMNPRPYFEDNTIKPVDSEAGWGNPSGHAMFTVAFYLTFWKICFQNKDLNQKTIEKYLSLVFIIILMVSIIISRLILAAHTINQLLYGASIGIGIYLFLFYILRIDTNCPEQLLYFIKIRNIIYICINSILLILGIVFYFSHRDNEIVKFYDKIIDKKFEENDLITYDAKKMQNDGLITIILFFANFSVFIAIKFELFFVFGGNINVWKSYNFNCNAESDTESLVTSLSPINNITQWNHTNTFIDIFRFLITILVLVLINFPFKYITWNDDFCIVVLFKILFPVGNTCFFIFFLLKIFLRKLRLTNNTLFSRMIDNTDNPFV